MPVQVNPSVIVMLVQLSPLVLFPFVLVNQPAVAIFVQVNPLVLLMFMKETPFMGMFVQENLLMAGLDLPGRDSQFTRF